MKQFYLYLGIFALLAGCSICDPDADTNSEDISRFVGTYKLTAWNAPVPVDIDQNGTNSRNLVTESPCYNPSKIILSSNRKYVKHDHYPDMESEGGTCGATLSNGTWAAQGNTIKLQPAAGDEEVYDYGAVNEILTRSESNWSFPIMNDSEGGYAYGAVNMVFTKE